MLIFDLESNGLLYEATHIHCIVIYDTDKGALYHYYEQLSNVNGALPHGTIRQGIERLVHASYICGHHICGFDVPLIQKLYGPLWPSNPIPEGPVGRALLGSLPTQNGIVSETPRCVDTNVLSNLLFPQQKVHGLDYWGKKLGREKPVQEQWERFDAAMLHRCTEDVLINVELWKTLQSRLIDQWEESQIEWSAALDIEQKTSYEHAWQEATGVRLDIAKAVQLYQQLDLEATRIRQYVVPRAPKRIVETHKGTPVNKPFKIDGSYSKMVVDFFGSEAHAAAARVAGPFTRIKVEELNLDSDDQVKKFLLTLGWRPTEWNISKVTKERTSPKLTEDSYNSLPPGLGKMVAEYNIVTHRRGMILNRKGQEKGALWNVRDDGRVAAEAFTCGTPTSRYRHKGSICNIPRPSSPYGEEVRGIYCVPDEWWMLGLDLKGIEIRMIAHFCYGYPGGKEMAELILSGDFHTRNAEIWEVTRDGSKPGLYGLCYGATAPKLAQILNKPAALANQLYNDFWNAYPALKKLVADLKAAYKARGHLTGVDGRRISIREERKLLNSLVQGGSAVIFKHWLHKNYMDCMNGFTKVQRLIAYHDEGQYEVRRESKSYAENVAKRFQQNALSVGHQFRIKVPIEADFKIGKNWAETH